MKSIEELMKRPYKMEVVPLPEERGYHVFYPDLPGCVAYGRTLERALDAAQEVKREWFQTALQNEVEIRLPDQNSDYSGKFVLRIPRSLHASLLEQAAVEGVSLNQYCVYLLTREHIANLMTYMD